MKNKGKIILLSSIMMIAMLTSCSGNKLVVSKIGYQSVRTTFQQPTEIPDDAEIVVFYVISEEGVIIPIVHNKTSEIMIIDQTMTFLVNTSGQSISYYDPTVRTTSNTSISSGTTGASVNLGAIAGAFGVGGVLGTALSGVNVGGANTSGYENTTTTVMSDQPRVSMAPKSRMALSKKYSIGGVGENSISNVREVDASPDNARSKFSICISYSVDDGRSFKKIVTDFYVNNNIVIPVKNKGRVNEALRELYTIKPDALDETWWLLHFYNNIRDAKKEDTMKQGIIIDYQ